MAASYPAENLLQNRHGLCNGTEWGSGAPDWMRAPHWFQVTEDTAAASFAMVT
ncbi:hypothetical protein GCM10025857_15870 [Alicyclobacillus contaminans]|nr:hypothetical protein GCM10025857_15870 [Alicyclobacillus contaminans]